MFAFHGKMNRNVFLLVMLPSRLPHPARFASFRRSFGLNLIVGKFPVVIAKSKISIKAY